MPTLPLTDAEVACIAQALRAYAYQCEKDVARNKGTSSERLFTGPAKFSAELAARFTEAEKAAKSRG